MTEDFVVLTRDLPQSVILDRKFGVREFTAEDLGHNLQRTIW